MALTAAQAMYGASFNPHITLKALSCFDDGNLQQLPQDAKTRLATAARDVDLDHLPSLGQLIGERTPEDDLGRPSRLKSFGSSHPQRRSPIRSGSWHTR